MTSIAVALTARTGKFQKKMKKAGKTVKKFAKIGAAAAVAVGVATAALVAQQLKQIDNLAKVSRAIGLTVNQLQAYHLAANLGGISNQVMEKSLKRLAKSVFDAGKGLTTAKDAFATLGLESDKLQNLTVDEVFKQVSDQVKMLGINTKTTGAVMDLFGARMGSDLMNVLTQGRDAIESTEKKIKDMGLAMSGLDTAAVEEVNDSWTRFKLTAKAMAQTFTVALAPAIGALIQMFTTSDGTARKLGDTVRWIASGVVKVVGWIGDAIQSIKILMVGATSTVVNSISSLMNGMASLGIISDDTAEDMAFFAKALEDESTALINADWFSDKLKRGMEEFSAQAKKTAEKNEELNKTYKDQASVIKEAAEQHKALEKARKDEEKRMDSLKKKGADLAKSLRTPFEKLADSIKEFQELLAQGVISDETFKRAVENAKGAFESSTGKPGAVAEKAIQTGQFKQIDRSRFAINDITSKIAPAPVADPHQKWQKENGNKMEELLDRQTKLIDKFISNPAVDVAFA